MVKYFDMNSLNESSRNYEIEEPMLAKLEQFCALKKVLDQRRADGYFGLCWRTSIVSWAK